MRERERFLGVMEYKEVDRVPNHEQGVWGQTIDRWEKEGLDIHDLLYDLFLKRRYHTVVDVNKLPPVHPTPAQRQ